MTRCGTCRNEVIIYDFDHNLDCYLGPTPVDPTPLTFDLAVACKVTGRPIYHHTRDRVDRRHVSRIWDRHLLPTAGHILPAHYCGARVPTTLSLAPDRPPIPDTCPF